MRKTLSTLCARRFALAAVILLLRPLPQAEAALGETVDVHCVDSDGKPVAGAEVHLFQCVGAGDNGRYLHTGPFKSDADGRAECGTPRFTDNEGDSDRFVYARVPDQLVGVGRSVKWKGRKPFNSDCRVVLRPSCRVDGTVKVPDGVDSAKVTVRVEDMHVLTGNGEMEFASWPREENFRGLDTGLSDIFECHPDASGRIHFDDVPKRGRLYLLTRCEGLAEAQWGNTNNMLGDAFQIDTKPEGILTGQVLSPDGEPVRAAVVLARLSAIPPNPPRHSSTFKAVTDEHGHFTIRGLPDWEFHLQLTDSMHRWVFRPQERMTVAAGERRELALQMETPVLVAGRVLDPDGKPVERADIAAVTEGRDDVGLDDARTDADGRFQFHLPGGIAKLLFRGVPDGFDYPKPEIVKELDIQPGQPPIKDLSFTLLRRKADSQSPQAP